MSTEPQQDTAEFTPFGSLFGPSPRPVRVDIGALTHAGKVRTNNEDHYLITRRSRTRTVLLTNLPEGAVPDVEEEAYAMAVADGIGGHAFGEIASRLALQTAAELGVSEVKWPLKMNRQEAQEVLEKLGTYADLLHDALVQRAHDRPELEGMGTTLTAAYTVGPEAFIGHIGDSRAYLWREGAIAQLTADHTLAQEASDRGLPVTDPGRLRHMRHVLTRSLGATKGPVSPDVRHFQLRDGDRLMLCTDGLSDLVSDQEIAAILGSNSGSRAACQKLVDLALERGGKDNVTVVVARYEFVNKGGKI